MRVISMVPSWTETLIEAGVEVVGRTRFCVHPEDKVKAIPVVGGTKDIDWEKVKLLNCDFLLLDKEENPKEFFVNASCATVVTHVRSCRDVANELQKLSQTFKNQTLNDFATRWKTVIERLSKIKTAGPLPSVIEWLNKPADFSDVVYVIWKNPYMAVARETFIGSVLDLIGYPTSIKLSDHKKLYPQINIEDFDKTKTLFLFSSEPFPFHKKKKEIQDLNIFSAIVDGESFSWFGTRSLKFLESI